MCGTSGMMTSTWVVPVFETECLSQATFRDRRLDEGIDLFSSAFFLLYVFLAVVYWTVWRIVITVIVIIVILAVVLLLAALAFAYFKGKWPFARSVDGDSYSAIPIAVA